MGTVPRTLRRPVGLLALLFLAYGLVSITWSHHPKVSIGAWGEVTGAALSGLLLHAALPGRVPAWASKLAAIAIALGCLSIVGELASGMALRIQLGVRSYPFIFKRSVTAILILLGPVAAATWLAGKRSVAVALVLLVGLAAYAAHSSATLVALAAALAAGASVWIAPRLGSRLLAAALAGALLIAPVLGDTVARLLPDSWVERLAFTHADQRIAVWQSFGEVAQRRPVGGAGFGTSQVMAQEPVAAEVPEGRRVMLGAWHPHNGYLQVWAETGAVGALLAGAGLVLAALGLSRLPRAQGVAGTALAGAAGSIMWVGHGIWQGWWSAVIAAAIVAIARLPDGAAAQPSRSTSPRKPVAST